MRCARSGRTTTCAWMQPRGATWSSPKRCAARPRPPCTACSMAAPPAWAAACCATGCTIPCATALLAGASAPRLAELRDPLAVPPDCASLLERAILPEPATVLREGGGINDGFDPNLDELRALQTNSSEFLVALEARERERSGIPNLKVEYNRVHGFYIEVTHAH